MRPYLLLPIVLACAPGTPPAAPTPAAAVDTGRVVVDGGTLYYESRGSGPVVVLLHGGGLDLRSWDPQVEALSSGFRVIRFDARGHGRSSARLDATPMSDDLRRVLDALGVRRASLVGASMGAGAALNFALAEPARVEKLALVSVSGPPPGVPRGPGVDLVAPAGRARFAALSMPRLVVLGEGDSPGVREAAEGVRNEAPGVEVVSIAGAAHEPNRDAPEAFNRLLLRFLRAR